MARFRWTTEESPTLPKRVSEQPSEAFPEPHRISGSPFSINTPKVHPPMQAISQCPLFVSLVRRRWKELEFEATGLSLCHVSM
jgi:hypothetical protein